MADARALQAAALVLAGGGGSTHTSQGAIQALAGPPASVRASQAAALVLSGNPVAANVTQAAALVLCHATPCILARCQCWQIIRQDGEAFHFTTHDEPVVFAGNTYVPCASLSASAMSASAFAGSAGGDVQISGVFDAAAISDRDWASGLYSGASVEVWEVSWRASAADPPRRVAKGVISGVQQGGIGYSATALSPGARLSQQPLIDVTTPACRWQFGAPQCGVNLAPLSVSGAVTAVEARNALRRASYRRFQDVARTEPDGYFDVGRLRWDTGLNAGIWVDVKSSAGGVITLWSAMPNEIAPGDEYTLQPGCDKRRETCKDRWDNLRRYGGYHELPGIDSISQTPDAKA